jgi:hypothetical protein
MWATTGLPGQVKLYGVASPENWFEDFGLRQSGGSAQIPLDPAFASTINSGEAYRIVAKRRGYESVRLEDVTEQMNNMRQHEAEMQARRAGRKNSVPPPRGGRPATWDRAPGQAGRPVLPIQWR